MSNVSRFRSGICGQFVDKVAKGRYIGYMIAYADVVPSSLPSRAEAEGLVLQNLRRRAGLSLDELARKTSISKQGLSRKENGGKLFADEREALCRVFGIEESAWNQAVAARMTGVDAPSVSNAPRVAAGKPSAAAAYNEEHGYQHERRADGAERVVVYGDSMEPLLMSGDSVWAIPVKQHASQPPFGQVVFVYHWDREADQGGPALGILQEAPTVDAFALVKANPRHKPLYIKRESVSAMCRVVEVSRRL